MDRLICWYGVLAAGLIGVGKTSVIAAPPVAAPPAAEIQSSHSLRLHEISSHEMRPRETIVILAQQTASRPNLRLGSVGEAVSELQAMLSLLGYYDGPIDGFYREQTQTAVVNFQAATNITRDGIVGPTTWQKLFPDPNDLPVATLPIYEGNSDDTTVVPESNNRGTRSTPATTTADSSQTTVSQSTSTGTSPTSAGEATSEAVDLPILRQGMHGPAVEQLQTRLQALGFYEGAIDGVFGPQTETAVQAMQTQNGLVVDGIVGPESWSILLK